MHHGPPAPTLCRAARRAVCKGPIMCVGRPRRTVVRGELLLIAAALVSVVSGCGTDIYDRVFVHSVRDMTLTPADYGHESINVSITAVDGQTLRGWYVPAPDSKATVIMHQGTAFNREGLLPWLDMLIPNGYSAILYDYRGFGTSDGQLPLFEDVVVDGLTVHAWAAENVDGPFYSVGISLGTIVALQTALHSDDVVGLVLDSPAVFADMIPISLATVFGFGEAGYVVGGVLTQRLLTALPPEYDMHAEIADLEVPVLFVVNANDWITPLFSGIRLYNSTPEPKQMLVTEALHAIAALEYPTLYEQTLTNFFDEALAWAE